MTETMNNSYDAAAYTVNGTARERVSLPGELFDGTVNVPVLHQAVKAFLANQRQGNAMTKTRGFVAGGNQKPWKQKGTGRARQGSIRAPNWVGGGTVFGPVPRSYAQYVPKQVRALARKSAFNARAREGAVLVVDQFAYEAPKTSRLAAMIARLGLAEQKVLILTDGVKPNVHLSGRNLPAVHVMPYSDVSAYHILWSDTLVIEAGAIGQTLAPIAESEPEPAPARARKTTTASESAGEGGAAPKKRATKKAAAKKTTKPAAKKSASAKSAKGESRAARKSAAKKSTKSAGKPKKKGS
jgi:large subunit ribosomal protein L4